MARYEHREVIDGHLTVTSIRTNKEDGRHVFTEIYAGETEETESIDDWVFPVPLIYDYSIAARTAIRQSKPVREAKS